MCVCVRVCVCVCVCLYVCVSSIMRIVACKYQALLCFGDFARVVICWPALHACDHPSKSTLPKVFFLVFVFKGISDF